MELKGMVSVGKLLSLCAALATEGGRIVQNIRSTGKLCTTFKSKLQDKTIGKDDPCTEADLTVQKLYYAGLRRHFPEIRLCGEENENECLRMSLEKEAFDRADELAKEIDEQFLERPGWNSLVRLNEILLWIDPLDGTKEFTLGDLDGVTSLIGISVNGVPLYGVVNKPFMGLGTSTTYFGGKGIGATEFSESKFTHLKAKKSIAVPAEIITCKYHGNKETSKVLNALKKGSKGKIFVEKSVPGTGNKILEIIRGNGDCFLFPAYGLKPWDTCAGDALLSELGGKMLDCHGNVVNYRYKNKVKGLICGQDPGTVQWITNGIQATIKDMKLDVKP